MSKERELIKILKNIALILEIKGENPFKSRAYVNAARLIKDDGIDIEKAVREGTLGDIKGFGKALQEKITDYVNNGKMGYYEKLAAEVPDGLLDLTKVPGIGAKKVKQLWENHHITSLDDLERACDDGSLANFKGFSSKMIEDILSSIHHIRAYKGKQLQQSIMNAANELKSELIQIEGVSKAEITGKVRRQTETVDSLEILVETDAMPEFDDYIIGGMPVKITNAGSEGFISMLHTGTGSEKYIESFNKLAEDSGISISESGVYKNGELIHISSEEQLYKEIGISYVPPELRENPAILEKAKNRNMPELIKHSDLKGMLHCHSTWSDGKNSIREMALASKDLGFEYFAICDHSRSAAYAGGLSDERVGLQHIEIDALNDESIGITVLRGIESDILKDGALDYPEKILSEFDVVVASVHSFFKMSKNEMTNRIIHAIRSPYMHILGHPTGRLLLARPAYEVDVREIIDAASDYGKIIELNANPSRLDISWEHLEYAKEKGVKIAINPDSHVVTSLSDIYTGVNMARKGGIEKSDVVNCLPAEDFMKYIIEISK